MFFNQFLYICKFQTQCTGCSKIKNMIMIYIENKNIFKYNTNF